MDYVIGEITVFEGGIQKNFIYKVNAESGTQTEKKVTMIHGYNGWSNIGKTRVYVSSRKAYQKCITFDMPFIKDKKILHHSILLNNTVFENKKRPMKKDFEILFHYPNQILRRTTAQSLWSNVSVLLNKPCTEEKSRPTVCPYYQRSYTTTFKVDNVQVMRKRNKPKVMCIENWKNDDVEFRTLISKRLKCQPNHWKLGLNLTKCVTSNEMANARASEDLPKTPSCRDIERYSFSHSEHPGLNIFDIETGAFKDTYQIDWNSDTMKSEIVSEITVHFIGKIRSSRTHNFDYWSTFLFSY